MQQHVLWGAAKVAQVLQRQIFKRHGVSEFSRAASGQVVDPARDFYLFESNKTHRGAAASVCCRYANSSADAASAPRPTTRSSCAGMKQMLYADWPHETMIKTHRRSPCMQAPPRHVRCAVASGNGHGFVVPAAAGTVTVGSPAKRPGGDRVAGLASDLVRAAAGFDR